jgi:hypothetical protein
MDINEVIGFLNPVVAAGIVFAILVAVIAIFYRMEKGLSSKLKVHETEFEKKVRLKKEIEAISDIDCRPEDMVKEIDKYARVIISEYITPGNKVDYWRLREYFSQRGQEDLESFCQKMVVALYSGEKMTTGFVLKILDDLGYIVDKYVVMDFAEEEKKKEAEIISRVQREKFKKESAEEEVAAKTPTSFEEITKEQNREIESVNMKEYIPEQTRIKKYDKPNMVADIDSIEHLKAKIDEVSKGRRYFLRGE